MRFAVGADEYAVVTTVVVCRPGNHRKVRVADQILEHRDDRSAVLVQFVIGRGRDFNRLRTNAFRQLILVFDHETVAFVLFVVLVSVNPGDSQQTRAETEGRMQLQEFVG